MRIALDVVSITRQEYDVRSTLESGSIEFIVFGPKAHAIDPPATPVDSVYLLAAIVTDQLRLLTSSISAWSPLYYL